MIAVKASRRLRLQEDEQDSLLAGVNFQIHHLGSVELLADGSNVDNVVEDIYSRYLTSAELRNSTLLAITVDTHQLSFFNVARNKTEFTIALTSIKSIHLGNKRNKYPKTITLVTQGAEGKEKAHVLHCTSQGKAKELHNAISRAFEYQVPDGISTDGHEEHKSKPRNNRVQPTDCGVMKLTVESKNSSIELEKPKSRNVVNTRRTGFSKIKSSPSRAEGKLDANQSCQDVERTRTKGKTKSTSQTKGAEGLGLLENIDPEEGFDDEFTDFARSRSVSETTFKWFGR